MGSTAADDRTSENMYATPAAAPAGSDTRLKSTLRPGMEWAMASTRKAPASGAPPSTVISLSKPLSRPSSEVAVTTPVTAAPAVTLAIRLTNRLVSARADTRVATRLAGAIRLAPASPIVDARAFEAVWIFAVCMFIDVTLYWARKGRRSRGN